MAPSRRETRSRTSSPYSGRPETRGRASSQAAAGAPTTPKAKQAQQEPSSRHRYGLRSMLSNLIWGSPVKAVEEESESGEDIDTDDDGDDEGLGPLTQDLAKGAAVQVISDDDEQQEERQPESAASTASSAPRRFTAAEKGKGSPKRTDSYSTTKYLPQQSAFPGGGLRSSQTFGDMRSIQRNVGLDIPTSTPNTSMSQQRDDLSSPGDVNSQLANFFAAKGSASLTAEERKKISEILLGGGNPSSAPADANVPTALTPNFSFHVPVPSAINANVSILSPAYKGLSRSNTTSGGLSNLASRATGGLTGSQSLSSLASLTNGPGGGTSAAANPRSALNRRQARPLYLGAGYSSQAIARRKRVQAQMGSLYSNLNSFDSATPAASGPSTVGTPGKRRRVGEDAASSTVVGTGSPVRSALDMANAPPTFSVESPAPLTSTPGPSKALQQQTSLFQSAPHLKAQFASTPARPSPLRAAAVATPSPPAKSAEPSPPRAMSKTVGLMRNIVGDTSEPSNRPSTSASAASKDRSVPTPITMTRTSKPPSRIPREELIKRAEPPSAAEILERSMPPSLRPTSNGKQARPKPPPVPGSARKTRAAAAADAEAQKEDKRKTKEQAKETLRVPPTRRSKSRSKTPDVPSEVSGAESDTVNASTTKTTAGQVAPAEKEGMQVDDQVPATRTAAPTKSAFSFGSGTPPTPAPSFFGKTSSSEEPAPATSEKVAPEPCPKPLFQFSAPAQGTSNKSAFSFTTAPAAEASVAASPPAAKPQGAFMEVDSTTSPAGESPTSAQDPKAEALKKPTISLPTFTLYETQFSFASSSPDDSEDAGVKAVKQTVLEIPKNELIVFDLL